MKASLTTIIFFSALLGPVSSQAGTVYKWTDENGVVHYGDKKPEEHESTTIKVTAKKPTTTTAESENQDTSKNNSQAPNGEDKKLREANAKAIQEKCTIAKTHSEKLSNASRVRINEDGNIRYLTDEEKQEKLKTAKTYISENCQ